MFKVITSAVAFVVLTSITTGFILSRGTPAARIKMHTKDLPEHGLIFMSPSDPAFDERLATLLKGVPNDVVEDFKPFSVFLENRSERTLVAYMIQWCFTGADGKTECQLKALSSPTALMEGEVLPESLEQQSGRIKPGAHRFLSLVGLDGSGSASLTITPEEAEQIKKRGFDQKALLKRYSLELAKSTDVTVTIDGAFFDDGTFVGPDTTGFFARTKALIDARKDLLQEVARGLSAKSKDEVFRQIELTADQPEIDLDSKSTPEDYYNHFKKFYAQEIMRMRTVQGDEKSLAATLQPSKKPWLVLRKKQDKK